jgi:TolA-binding protein
MTEALTCARCDELLLDFAYGELQGEAQRDVSTHLSGCVRCQGELAKMASTRKAMRVLRVVEAPDSGLESLLAMAERAAKARSPAVQRPFVPRWLVPGVATALALSAVVAVTAVLMPLGSRHAPVADFAPLSPVIASPPPPMASTPSPSAAALPPEVATGEPLSNSVSPPQEDLDFKSGAKHRAAEFANRPADKETVALPERVAASKRSPANPSKPTSVVGATRDELQSSTRGAPFGGRVNAFGGAGKANPEAGPAPKTDDLKEPGDGAPAKAKLAPKAPEPHAAANDVSGLDEFAPAVPRSAPSQPPPPPAAPAVSTESSTGSVKAEREAPSVAKRIVRQEEAKAKKAEAEPELSRAESRKDVAEKAPMAAAAPSRQLVEEGSGADSLAADAAKNENADPVGAAAMYEEAAALRPTDPRAATWLYRAASLYQRSKEFHTALAVYLRVRNEYPTTSEARKAMLKRADIFRELQRAEDEEQVYVDLPQQYPASHEAAEAQQRFGELRARQLRAKSAADQAPAATPPPAADTAPTSR